MKLIETFKGADRLVKIYWCADRLVKIYWCAEWSEYQCKVYYVKNGAFKCYVPATYYTGDKTDAIDTARKMLARQIKVTH